jgi:arylsulfatase A-like enzyme
MDTRTPLMFRFPGMPKPGVATEAMVEYVDIYPTVVELAGLPPAPDLDGTNFVPVLNDPTRDGRRFVLSQFARPFDPTLPEVMGYSVRTRAHRYTRWVRWPSRDLLAEEFYDYTASRSAVRQDGIFVERENVIHDPAYRELREQLGAMMDQTLEARTNIKELKQQRRESQ